MACPDFSFKGRVIKSYANDTDENNPIAAACTDLNDEIVFSCHSEKVIAWNMHSCDRVGTLEAPNEAQLTPVTCCSIGKDLLATGHNDGAVHLWKHNTFSRVARIVLPHAPIVSIALSPNGKLLAVAYADAKPRVFQVHSSDGGQIIQGPSYMELAGSCGKVTDMVFSSCSYNLLTTSSEGSIQLWKAISGELLGSIESEDGPVLGADFSGDSNICYLTEKGITVFDVSAGQTVWKIEGEYRLMACGRSSHALVAVTYNGRLTCYNIAQQKETVKKGTAHSDEILTCRLSSSGRHFVTGGADGKLFLWE